MSVTFLGFVECPKLFGAASKLILAVVMLVLFTGCGGGSSSSELETAIAETSVPTTESESETTNPDESAVVVDVDDEGNTTVSEESLASALDDIAPGDISEAELAGLLLMREEEKLARDVYIALFDIHDLKIFSNISSSEQSHTDAVLALLNRYHIADPVGSNAFGVFTNMELQMLYDALVAARTPLLMGALFVGAKIEELDIADIEPLKTGVVDNDDILLVYDNLLMGSRNHLRAFNKQIVNNGWTYEPEYISQEAYDFIVNGDNERGDNG